MIDAFLDLVVEEKLETRFLQAENNIDDEAVKRILTYPNAFIGLGDGGAHVQFHGGYGYTTRLLGEWVREKQAMTLEQAVKRLTFESASTFGINDRGLLREGLAADIVLFDPNTVKPGQESVVHDFPGGRLADQGAGYRHSHDDRQWAGAAGGWQAHWRAAGAGGAEFVVPRASELMSVRGRGADSNLPRGPL